MCRFCSVLMHENDLTSSPSRGRIGWRAIRICNFKVTCTKLWGSCLQRVHTFHPNECCSPLRLLPARDLCNGTLRHVFVCLRVVRKGGFGFTQPRTVAPIAVAASMASLGDMSPFSCSKAPPQTPDLRFLVFSDCRSESTLVSTSESVSRSDSVSPCSMSIERV